MSFVIKFVKGVRNHWKKSTFAAVALAYGINYGIESYEIQQLMRKYCEEAKKYGDQPILDNQNPRKITVILNPNANKRKASKLFESYCVPILNLAGVCVDVVQTQSEGHARNLVEDIKQTDAIIIAGGDGTVSEVITGLMRRADNKCSIGVLPVGRTNTFAGKLFPGGDHLPTVKALADAALAVVTEKVCSTNVIRIEVVPEDENSPNKPIYAVTGLEWGAYRDAQSKQDKYWVFGSLRKYVTYVFNGYKNSLSWNCAANILYTPPCAGCSNCYKIYDNSSANSAQKGRWWTSFVSTNKNIVQQIDNEKLTKINEECSRVISKEIATSDLSLVVSDINSEPPELKLRLGPSNVSYFDFITQGWLSEQGKSREIRETINLRYIELIPKIDNSDESWFSIDRENYEVKPVRITLLPNAIKVFCKEKHML